MDEQFGVFEVLIVERNFAPRIGPFGVLVGELEDSAGSRGFGNFGGLHHKVVAVKIKLNKLIADMDPIALTDFEFDETCFFEPGLKAFAEMYVPSPFGGFEKEVIVGKFH